MANLSSESLRIWMLNELKKHDAKNDDDIVNIFRKTPARIVKEKTLMIRAMEKMLTIQRKDKTLAKIQLNETQRRIIDAIYEMYDAGLPVRLLELKGRQQGSSTVVGAYNFMRTICEPNTNALIITEEKGGSAQNIFAMYQRYKEHFPIPLDVERTRQGQHLEFSPPIRSQIKVEGEKNVTSFTYHLVHLSEAAMFASLSKTLNMLNQTVPEQPDTCVILETTANAYGDDFHQEFQRAREGKSEWKAVFIPWFAHKEYEIAFEDDTFRDQFVKSLSDSPESPFGNELALMELHAELTPEKMRWRRNAIRNKCGGVIQEFNRQYPPDPESAFVTSGQKVVDLGAIQWHIAQDAKDPIARGYFRRNVDNSVRWVDDPLGVCYIWQTPKPKRDYLAGSDHAEGLDSGDHNVGMVMCRLPRVIVAKIRGYDGRRIDTDEFAEQMALMCEFYNNATACPENNLDGGRVIDAMRLKYGYANIISESLITRARSPRYGWRNNGPTRRRMVRLVIETIAAKDVVIHDRILLNQLLSWTWHNGKAEAEKKGQARHDGSPEQGYYDDDVFAFGSMLLADEALPPPVAMSEKDRREKQRYEDKRGFDIRRVPKGHFLRLT